jgi:two-component system cell cycle sensor histidine kinase/response regulator CckA
VPSRNPAPTDVLSDVPWAAWAASRAPDGTITIDYASQEAASLLGIEPDALGPAASSAFTHVSPEDAERLMADLERSATHLTAFRAEFRVNPPGHPPRWVEARAIPRHEPDGQIRWRGLTVDATARRVAESQLRGAYDLLDDLIDQAPLAIAMFDRDMCYLAYSRRWFSLFNQGRSDLLGLNHYDVLPDLPEAYRRAHREGLEGRSKAAEDDLLVAPDGTRSWMRWAVHPWRDADGAVGGIILWVEDVTERKRAEEAALESERKHRRVLESIPVALWVIRDGLISLANDEAARLLGAATPQALVGRDAADLVPSGTGSWRTVPAASPNPTPGPRVRLCRLDGDERVIELTVQTLADADGPSDLVMARDLTGQLQAEALARDSEARLQGIIQSVMDGIVTVDESHHIVVANAAAERMFGYGPGALLGMSLSALVPATRRAAHQAAMARFAASPNPHQTMGAAGVTLEGLHASGEVFPMETSVSKATVAGRAYYTAVHRDLAPRLRTEGALATERERFRQLAEAIREVFWLMDVDTSQILYVSPAYETVWGRSCESLYRAGHAWREAVHPEDQEIVDAALPRQLSGDYDVEYRVVRPDGTVRWVHDQAFPIADATGRVVRVAGVAEDITTRRTLEEQVRQTQRLESMGRLAGGVAHDFNNLLTVILSSVDLLGEGTESVDEAMTDIADAARRGATLTRQLLAFTRQEVVEPRPVELSTVIDDADRLLRRLIGEDIELVTAADPASGTVRVDPGQWSQVVFNLAVNARDAMPNGGRLRIATYPVDAEPELAGSQRTAAGPWEILEVSDNGCGMPPDVRQRIFEPFFTTKARGQGTGLGLAVVYGVVQQAGGRIEVDTEGGRGTTFRIFVPRFDEPVRDGERETNGSPRRGRERVLLVEDEDAVRRVAERILSAQGYEVTAVADGAAALSWVESTPVPPHVLVTDVVMPGIDGARLAEALRARLPSLRVLFTSGYIDDTITRRDVPLDETGFLQKPYSPSTLAARLRQLLDQSPR